MFSAITPVALIAITDTVLPPVSKSRPCFLM
jgi:hypothetical protein